MAKPSLLLWLLLQHRLLQSTHAFLGASQFLVVLEPKQHQVSALERPAETSTTFLWMGMGDSSSNKRKKKKHKNKPPAQHQHTSWNVIVNDGGTAESANSKKNQHGPLVIVDGHNIIHEWEPSMNCMRQHDLAQARQLLIDSLENLALLKKWRIEVVFDGTRRPPVAGGSVFGGGGGSGHRASEFNKVTHTSLSQHGGVHVVFSAVGEEADAFIMQRCEEAHAVTKGLPVSSSFIVVTSDAMIRTAASSAGAHCMSADSFVSELDRVKETLRHRVALAVAASNQHAPCFRNLPLIRDNRNRTKT